MRPSTGTGADPAGPGNGLSALRRRGVLAAVGAVVVVAVASAAAAWVLTGRSVASAAARQGSSAAARPAPTSVAARTSCSSVAHIGDSTSVGMVSATWLPDASQRLAAQYTNAFPAHGLRRTVVVGN